MNKKFKIICELFGHKFLFNFVSMPNKAICKRCGLKAKWDLRHLAWRKTNEFQGEKRTDLELIKKWHRL